MHSCIHVLSTYTHTVFMSGRTPECWGRFLSRVNTTLGIIPRSKSRREHYTHNTIRFMYTPTKEQNDGSTVRTSGQKKKRR